MSYIFYLISTCKYEYLEDSGDELYHCICLQWICTRLNFDESAGMTNKSWTWWKIPSFYPSTLIAIKCQNNFDMSTSHFLQSFVYWDIRFRNLFKSSIPSSSPWESWEFFFFGSFLERERRWRIKFLRWV